MSGCSLQGNDQSLIILGTYHKLNSPAFLSIEIDIGESHFGRLLKVNSFRAEPQKTEVVPQQTEIKT